MFGKAVKVTLLAAVIGVSAIACSTQAEPPVSPPPSEQPTTEPTTPAPTETPEPEPEPLVIPSCGEIVTTEQIRALFGDRYKPSNYIENNELWFTETRGPSALEALEQVTQQQFCVWGVPNSDDAKGAMIADLPNEARDTFLAALRDSVYEESTEHDAAVFTWIDNSSPVRHHLNWYAFDEDLWVFSTNADLGAEVLNSVRAANPDRF